MITINKIIFFSLLSIGMIVSGCGTSSKVDNFVAQVDQNTPNTTETVSWTVNIEPQSNPQSDRVLLEATPDQTDGKRWLYKDYSSDLLTQAKTAWQRVVIVVYDKTNDSCVRLDRDINMSLGRIPSDVIILKLEYEQARALYQTKTMNTVIYMNASGKITNTSEAGIYTMDSLLYYL